LLKMEVGIRRIPAYTPQYTTGWRYSPTAASTAQHPGTCRDNCSESLVSARVSDSALRHPLHSSFRGPVEPPSAPELILCCCDFSLEQLAGSSPFFGISGVLPKVAEDGTVYTSLTTVLTTLTRDPLFFLSRYLEVLCHFTFFVTYVTLMSLRATG